MRSKSTYFFILLFMAFLLYQGCYPLPERPPKKDENGTHYGITEGLFRHRWWNYYERGLSFADGEFWQDAESDLREAVRQRKTDKRRARTYGLHFIDYFPHRELGIVLFEQGRIEEAEKELALSYSHVKSEKTELYLDRVRKALIEKKQLPHHKPEITIYSPIHSPNQPYFTNQFSVSIKGIAQNDAFVRHITVNQQKVRVDISKQTVDFQSEVLLVPGENKIRITAENLMGDTSEAFVKVNVDNTGPVISIDKLDAYEVRENSIYLTDDSGLAELSVNGRKINLNGIKEFRFPDKPLSFPITDELIIETKDIAGNITTAKLPFSKSVSKLLADNRALPTGILRASAGNESPVIDLKHPSEDECLTYQDYVFVDGNISNREGISELLINNQQILKSQARNYFFSKKIRLDKGRNEIVISGKTVSGKSVSKKVEITRKSLSDIRPPLKLAISDFKRTPENVREYITHDFETALKSVIKQHGRFEIGIPDNDCILAGMITERPKGVELSLDLRDTETKESLTSIVDAYSENIGSVISDELAKKIEQKLNDELPVKQGIVIENDNKQLIIDMGTEAKIKKGMKIMIYDIKPIIHPETGKRLDWKFLELGQAKIINVSEKISYAALDNGMESKAIHPKHPVVTR